MPSSAAILRFNPRAPCGARRPYGVLIFKWSVSIHAPRAGRDATHLCSFSCTKVSIHAPRAGRDAAKRDSDGTHSVFQSTRPVRGATMIPFGLGVPVSFNPRAPCGARHTHL